jgi:transposase
VPGHKTDVKDAEWIADLLRHGLLRASFVPDRPQRELPELTRYRTALVRERASEPNRLQKTLEGANIKHGDVATNVLGRSAREMLEGLVAGHADPATLAQFARGRMREKIHNPSGLWPVTWPPINAALACTIVIGVPTGIVAARFRGS